MASTAIDYTQISARGCRGESGLESQQRVLDLVISLGNRAGFLISAKLAGMSKAPDKSGDKGLASLHRADQRLFAKSSGFAEIIVQHAPHDTRHLKYAGADFELNSHRIERAIALALKRRVPVNLHVELNDNERASKRILRQLKALAEAHPKAEFLLMHMGQASLAEAADLIKTRANIHFITSSAGPVLAAAIQSKGRSGAAAQIGWINMFNAPPPLAPYSGWLREYFGTMQWQPGWKALIEAHPTRFVFAMDRVFGHHWTKRGKKTLKIWRQALAQLSPAAAGKVACANAKRLWRLRLTCRP
jgi:predicted TIM-barrel fold metal-dependent hydrolase